MILFCVAIWLVVALQRRLLGFTWQCFLWRSFVHVEFCWLIDWLSYGFMSHPTQNRSSRGRSSHWWTVYVLPKSPKEWHKNAMSPVKFNFCRKKSATKFLCMKTNSGKVVATFPYLTVHRSIAGDVPIYKWNWRSKWHTPSENTDFERFRIILLTPWQLPRILSATKI